MSFGDKLRARTAEHKATLSNVEKEDLENHLMTFANNGKNIRAYVVTESLYEHAPAYDKWSKANNINFEYFDEDGVYWFRFSW